MLFDNHVDAVLLRDSLFKERHLPLNPIMFKNDIFKRAKAAQQHIVLPEASE